MKKTYAAKPPEDCPSPLDPPNTVAGGVPMLAIGLEKAAPLPNPGLAPNAGGDPKDGEAPNPPGFCGVWAKPPKPCAATFPLSALNAPVGRA